MLTSWQHSLCMLDRNNKPVVWEEAEVIGADLKPGDLVHIVEIFLDGTKFISAEAYFRVAENDSNRYDAAFGDVDYFQNIGRLDTIDTHA